MNHPMIWALNRLAKSHHRAMLGTSTGRIWAVKVYLDMGFVPDPVELNNPTIVATWRELEQALPHPALTECLSQFESEQGKDHA
ncbi:hypothetical protein KFU94_08395 [Chloroflexi bacterium TSY]|nr:hypothetical protein [Chloroflexi bacterium TSY]